MPNSSLSGLFAGGGRSARRLLLSSSSRSPGRKRTTTRVPSPFPFPVPRAGVESTVDSLFRERDIDRLVSRFKEAAALPRFRGKHRVYEVVVRRLAAAGRLDAVSSVLEAQKQTDDITHEGFATRLIVLYGRVGMAAAAENTFRQLPGLGCKQTVLSFNALLTAFSDAGEFDDLDRLFISIPEENSEIVPDEVSYNILIGSMCKRCNFDGAMRFLTAMETRGMQPGLITFNTLLNGFYANGHFSEAEKIWSLMAEKNCAPDVKSFNAKLRGLVLQGRTSEAVQLVWQLPTMGLKPDTFSFNALIKGHCREGNLDQAKEVFEDLTKRECRPNRQTFETLVPALCQAAQLDFALHLCNESISRKCCVSAEVLQSVVDGLCRESRIDDSEKLAELARLNVFDGNSINLSSQPVSPPKSLLARLMQKAIDNR